MGEQEKTSGAENFTFNRNSQGVELRMPSPEAGEFNPNKAEDVLKVFTEELVDIRRTYAVRDFGNISGLTSDALRLADRLKTHRDKFAKVTGWDSVARTTFAMEYVETLTTLQNAISRHLDKLFPSSIPSDSREKVRQVETVLGDCKQVIQTVKELGGVRSPTRKI